MNLFFFKKRKAINLVCDLNKTEFLLDYENQHELNVSVEIWHSDCLEYNVNKIYEYIKANSIEAINLEITSVIEYCQVDNNFDLSKVQMRPELRKAKLENPIIILENSKILLNPFIINGNHRIINAYKRGEKSINTYKLNPDNIIECLSTEGYKKAYKLYQKLLNLIPLRLI